MTGIAYLASIIAVVWLSYWLLQNSESPRNRRIQPKRNPRPNLFLRWTPFDFEIAETSNEEPAKQDRLKGWRSRTTNTRPRG